MKFYYLILFFNLFIFFGCTPQGNGLLSTSFTSTSVTTKVASAPFAFDVAIDTISYNSCNSVASTDGSTIPGFKFGANEGFTNQQGNGAVNAGLKLRSEFLTYIGQNFNATYPESTISATQIVNVLKNSDLNKDIYLQFSLRKKSDLSILVDLISPGSLSVSPLATVDRDVKVLTNSLTSDLVSSLLTKNIQYTEDGGVLVEGPRVYNLADSNDVASIEATLNYNAATDSTYSTNTTFPTSSAEYTYGAAEYYPEAVRKKLYSSSSDKVILTALFGGSQSESSTSTSGTTGTVVDIKKPLGSNGLTTTDKSKAYGRGFSFVFGNKSSTGAAGWLNNVITGVTEYDLSTGSVASGVSWSCFNVVITPTSQWNNKKANQPTCAPLQTADLTTSRQNMIKKIRRHYSPADWNIGLFYSATTLPTVSRTGLSLCMSPKNLSCYLPTTGILDVVSGTSDVGVNYDPTTECYLTAYSLLGISYSSASTADLKRLKGRCAQYASICVRATSN